MKRRLGYVLLLPVVPLQAAAALALLLWGGSWVVEWRSGGARAFLSPDKVASVVIEDRAGKVLREPLGRESGARGRWVALRDVSPRFVDAVVAAEDERFWSHPGVDPLALARAAAQDLLAMRLVSGGSTITQQVVKVVSGRRGRSPWRKLYEMMGALFLERRLSKEEILEAYVNRVPLGNLTQGVEAASRHYLRKPAAHLTLAEAAALAALIKAPTALNPARHPARLEKRRRWVLGRMRELGMIGAEDLAYARSHPPAFARPVHPFLAPHLVEEVLDRAGREKLEAGEITTTLDRALQEKVEHLARGAVEKVRHLDVTNAAAVVLDNATGEALAYVGSVSYFDEEGEGMNDGVMARRSPGSALKPFVYAAAFEKGMAPATVVADVQASFPTPAGTYRPENYDGRFHGPVRLRTALGSSYNVPAVKLAAILTPAHLLARLRAAGLASLDKDAEHYGVALALGDGEVTLWELAGAYAALAAGGVYRPPGLVRGIRDAQGAPVALPARPAARVFGPQASWLVTDILCDKAARGPAFGKAEVFDFPYPVAVKTGTSHDYRDNWTVGYSRDVTVGVWVGNFSGKPMGNVSGITGAGPLFRQVMTEAMRGKGGGAFPAPPGIVRAKVCALSGKPAGHSCPQAREEVFAGGTVPPGECDWHVAGKGGEPAVRWPDELASWAMDAGAYDAAAQGWTQPGGGEGGGAILDPADGAVFVVDPDVPRGSQKLKVRASCGVKGADVTLLVDGKPAAVLAPPYVFSWQLVEGEHTFAASCAGGTGEAVTVTVH